MACERAANTRARPHRRCRGPAILSGRHDRPWFDDRPSFQSANGPRAVPRRGKARVVSTQSSGPGARSGVPPQDQRRCLGPALHQGTGTQGTGTPAWMHRLSSPRRVRPAGPTNLVPTPLHHPNWPTSTA
jgi:hypothetical protein